MPISAPVPTADIGCDLVKISASGPMPTSRYCDHAPCAISASLSRAASGEPGRTLARSSPMTATIARRTLFGLGRVSARLLLDHAFEHARDERDAGRLDRLQVAWREQPRQRGRAGVLGGIREHIGECGDARQDAGGADRRDRIGEVQQRARRRRDRATGRRDRRRARRASTGPSTAGRKTRPTSVACSRSAGRVAATVRRSRMRTGSRREGRKSQG